MSLSFSFASQVTLSLSRDEAWQNLTTALGGRQGPVRLLPLHGRRPVTGRLTWQRERGLISWRGRWRGLSVYRVIELREVADGVRLSSREEVRGWLLLLLRPFFSPRKLAREGSLWLARLAAGPDA